MKDSRPRCACCDETPQLRRETGTRAELVDTLREMAQGWHFLCKDKLSAAAADAADGLEAGSFCVKVGHTVYTVSDEEAYSVATGPVTDRA